MQSSTTPLAPLTGLRGVAILLVMLSHYFDWRAPFRSSTAPPIVAAFFDLDQLGMTLFFTLSGFVIAYNYLDLNWAKSPWRSVVEFAFLRFSRLYPALIVFFLLILLHHPRGWGDVPHPPDAESRPGLG
jgi:peptidoglycan/LPS O-acetylase OafA/YrhL